MPDLEKTRTNVRWLDMRSGSVILKGFGAPWTLTSSAGTREKWIDVPCGINIKTRDVGLCDAVQSELQVNLDLLNKAAAMCDCIPKALALSTDGSLRATDAISDASSVTSRVLAVYAELQKVSIPIQ